MSADWVQAVGVLFSFAVAGLGYIQARRSAARTALRKILNMADEFPLLIDDEARYKYFELSQDEHKDFNYEIWVKEVEDFNDEFRTDLNNLWGALDNLRLFPWSKDKYSDTLNSGNLVRKALERMLFILQTEDIKNVQNQKEFVAQVLLKFSDELYRFADTTKWISSNNLADLYQSLKCYVKNKEVIIKAIVNYKNCDDSNLKELSENEEFFYLSEIYKADKKREDTHKFSWEDLKAKINFSDVDRTLKEILNADLLRDKKISNDRVKPAVAGQDKSTEEENNLAIDIVREVAKREALEYEKATFKLNKAHPEKSKSWLRVVFKSEPADKVSES